MCDLIFSGVFERHPRLTLAIVEFELAWAPHLLSMMDHTYRERHGEAIYRFKGGMLPSDFFHRNVVLSFQEDAIGIRLRDVIGVDNMMWGSDYPHSESTFPQSRKILTEILAGVTDDEQAKIAGANTARVYNFDVARLTVPGSRANLSAARCPPIPIDPTRHPAPVPPSKQKERTDDRALRAHPAAGLLHDASRARRRASGACEGRRRAGGSRSGIRPRLRSAFARTGAELCAKSSMRNSLASGRRRIASMSAGRDSRSEAAKARI
jgi:hypothetical protein